MRAARICSRVQGVRSGERAVIVSSPVGLNEDAVDRLKIDDASLITDGLDEASQAEVARAPEEAFGGTDD